MSYGKVGGRFCIFCGIRIRAGAVSVVQPTSAVGGRALAPEHRSICARCGLEELLSAEPTKTEGKALRKVYIFEQINS